jgi:hypothetical protein
MHRLHLMLLVAVLLLLGAVALPQMDEAIWWDEQRTLFYAGAPPQYGPTTITETIQRVAENRWQGPAYFTVMWGWGRLAGWDPVPMRWFSLLVGLLGAASTYALSRSLFGRSAALYAALTFSLSAFYVNFLHDMRGYTLFYLMCVAVLLAYRRAIQQGGWLAYLLLTCSLAVLPYLHYFMAFMAAGLGLTHLFRFRERRFWPVLACFVVAALAFLPWAQVFLAGAAFSAEAGGRVDNMSIPAALWSILEMAGNGSQALVLTLIAIAFIVPGAVRNRRLLVGAVGGGLALALVSTRVFEVLNEVRYLIFVWVGLAPLIGLGIDALGRARREIPWLLMGAWSVAFVVGLVNPAFQRTIYPWETPAFDQLKDVLRPLAVDGDRLIYLTPPEDNVVDLDGVLAYYLHDIPLDGWRVVQDTFAMTDATYADLVRRGAGEAERAWLAYDPSVRPWQVGPTQEQTLPGEGYLVCGDAARTDRLQMQLFAKSPTNGDVVFEALAGDLTVTAYDGVVSTGEALHTTLAWTTTAPLPETSLALHIEDAAGTLVAQADIGTPGPGCEHLQLTTAGWASGTYRAYLLAYNWRTGDRLPIQDAAGERWLLGAVSLNHGR